MIRDSQNCTSQNRPGFAMAINLALFSKHGSKLFLTISKNQIKLKSSCQWKYSKWYVVGSTGNSNTLECLEQWPYHLNEEKSPKVTTLQRIILIWMYKVPLHNRLLHLFKKIGILDYGVDSFHMLNKYKSNFIKKLYF